MQVVTIKAKPKTIFGIILAVTGILVLILTFVANHSATQVDGVAALKGATAEDRQHYLSALGWEWKDEQEKQITIPAQFNEVYTEYNEIQKQQGFDLTPYKGKSAVLYTYSLTNYPDNPDVIADLIVSNGEIIGADLCDPDAENGFLIALTGKDGTT